MSERVNKCGAWGSTIGENISYGSTGGQDIVFALIVDDGVSSRGHRKNIFNPKFLLMGSGTSTHKGYRTMTVIDYAGTYTGNGKCPLIKVNTNTATSE